MELSQTDYAFHNFMNSEYQNNSKMFTKLKEWSNFDISSTLPGLDISIKGKLGKVKW